MGNSSGRRSTFGLTPQEKRILRDTWKVIKKDLSRNGLVIFLMFLGDYPNNLQYFPFKSDKADELEKEPLVKLHALRVMRDITFYVDNMDRQEVLLHSLRQNALNHRNREIAKAAYDDLRVSILKGMAHQLGPQKFKPEAELAWDKALRVIFQVITDINDEKKCLCTTAEKRTEFASPGASKRVQE